MRSIGSLAFVAKPILPQRSHVKHSPRLRRTCNLILNQYKAVKLTKWDPQGFDGLEVQNVQKPEVGPSEVLVRVKLRPVNPADISLIQGRMGRPPLPLIPGTEGLGVVEECGPEVTRFQAGQRVVCVPSKAWSALDGSGSWQQVMLVPEANLYPVPDEVADKVAAQFSVTTLTVYALLEAAAAASEGKWLAQTAGGSFLGRQVISLAKHRGIKVINLVRRAAQKEELLSLGTDAVVATDGSDGDVAAKILECTGGQSVSAALDCVGGTASSVLTASVTSHILEEGGQGVSAALDCVGGEATRAVTASLLPGGSTIIYGALGGPVLQMNILDVFLGKSLKPFILRQWLSGMDNETREQVLVETMSLLRQGIIEPYTGKVFPLEEARAAAAESIREGRGGKVYIASD